MPTTKKVFVGYRPMLRHRLCFVEPSISYYCDW